MKNSCIKRNIQQIILLSFMCLAMKGQVLIRINNESVTNYSYVGGDEFNQTNIDKSFWHLTPWPKTNMAQFFAYSERNSEVKDGVLELLLKREDSTYSIGPLEIDSNFLRKRKIKLENQKYLMKYSAGSLISAQKFHYGLYELRFKIEEGKGVWPAFWFYGGNKNEEIDVFELKGERLNQIHVDTHCPYGCDNGYKNKWGFATDWGGWIKTTNNLNNGFNIMLLEWREDGVTWYLNGSPIANFKGSFLNPMNIYINTQVASDFSAFQPGPDQTLKSPNIFYVDYLRIWKKNNAQTACTLKTNHDGTSSKKFESDYLNRMKSRKNKTVDGFISLQRIEPNKILISTFGKVNRQKTGLIFRGAFGNYEVKGFESEVILNPNETKLEMELILPNHTIHQAIILN